MPFYHKLGNIPHKRHTQFRKSDGSLHYEQLYGTIGFDGMSTNSYHEYHMVGNVGWNQMNTRVKWYDDVMGFENFLSFDDKQIHT